MTFFYNIFGGSLRNLRYADTIEEDDPYYPRETYDVLQRDMLSLFGGHQLVGISEATWNKTAKALAKILMTPNEGATYFKLRPPTSIHK